MKLIPFPTGGEAAPDPQEIAALEAALAGSEARGAEAWRELRGDIRSLAPPIDADFRRTLELRLAPAPAPAPQRTATPAPDERRGAAARRRLTGIRAPRTLALGGAGALAALLVALLLVGPFAAGPARTTTQAGSSVSRSNVPAEAVPSVAEAEPTQVVPSEAVHKAAETPAPASSAAATPAPGAAIGGSTRVQQLGASMTLSGTPSEVQKLADGVGRIATAEGGYVTNSQVQVEAKGASSATLQLSVPSGHLARTLAALGRLGSVRAETQSLQDITGAYDSSRRALSDAVAERTALLRALGAASTQGQIESLHRRLGLAGSAIRRASAAFAAISSRAGNSAVEVTVVGEAQAAGHDLTLSRGLDDAGRVLTVALVVGLIGLAGLIPLLALIAALTLGFRVLRRSARERALGGS